MEKNQIIDLEITALTSEGSGIGKHNGIAVFVPFTAVGDKIKAKILKVKSSYAYGKIEEIITSSTDRIENDCTVFTKCGGCVYRHINYEAEKRAKNQIVIDAFTRIGGLNPEFLPFYASDKTDRYRNKAQFPVGKNENAYYGLFAPFSHRIVAVNDCKIQPICFNEIAKFIIDFVNENKISVYDESVHQGVLRNIYIRQGHYSKEICVCLVARRNVPEFKKLAREVMQKFGDIVGVVVNINKEKTNVILGEKEILLAGKETILDKMCENKVIISPKSFYQVNTQSAELLYKIASDFVDLKGKNVLDLYSGIGTISMHLARVAKSVIGVEIVPPAIENANLNKQLNSLENLTFVESDAEAFVEQYQGEKIDIIFVDPPRKGCSMQTLKSIAEIAPSNIVMISCNPATAARDCKALGEQGYRTERVVGVDLFARTGHVELVALMSRVEK